MATIQVRRVPDDVHRRLREKASAQGKSLTEFLLPELIELAERPTPAEIWERLETHEPVELNRPVADIIREERDAGANGR